MNLPFFITKRIAFSGKGFSSFVVKIAVVAVGLSIATMVITTALVNGFQKEINQKTYGFFGHVHVSNLATLQTYEDNHPIKKDQDFLPIVREMESVSHVQSFARKPAILKTKTEIEGIVLKGIGPDFNWDFFQQYLVEGDPFRVNDSTKSDQIVISEITANRLNLKVGDKILIYFVQKPLRQRRPTISGIYKTGLAEFDEAMALYDIGHLQKLNGWEKDDIGGFEIFLDNEQQQSPIRSILSGMTFYIIDYFATIITNLTYDWHLNSGFPYIQLTPPDPVLETTEAVHALLPLQLNARSTKENEINLFEWVQIQDINRLVILVLVAAIAIINMVTVLLILILERTNMIGILKALGSDNWQIRKIFLYNAGFIIGIGIIAGNVLGIGLCWLQQTFEFIQLPEESYYISTAPIDLNFWVIFGLNIGTLLICLLALIIPSYLVTRIDPIKAIRFN